MDDSRWSAFNNTRDDTDIGSSITGLIVLDMVCLFVKIAAAVGVKVVVNLALEIVVVFGFWYGSRFNDHLWLLFVVLNFVCGGWSFCGQLPPDLSIIIYALYL